MFCYETQAKITSILKIVLDVCSTTQTVDSCWNGCPVPSSVFLYNLLCSQVYVYLAPSIFNIQNVATIQILVSFWLLNISGRNNKKELSMCVEPFLPTSLFFFESRISLIFLLIIICNFCIYCISSTGRILYVPIHCFAPLSVLFN